jgi:predicted DNA binding CopG/RHH family protein
VLDIGGKESNFMKNKIQYTDEPMGDLRVVRDFLPPPHELVFEEDTVKVTIGLSRSSVDFFKREASRNHTAYQKMIRRLLDVYASRYEHETPSGNTARR